MKYQSELIKEIVDSRGHEMSSLHYESECIETWIEETKGAYPKLCDYESEWLNYIIENPNGVFPYVTITDVTNATVNHVVPYAYKSAILSGNTCYRDIDTGEILESFEEDRNLELVSVKMPVLTTTGKNLFDGKLEKGVIDGNTGTLSPNDAFVRSVNFIKVQPNKTYVISEKDDSTNFRVYEYDGNFNYIGYLATKTFTTSSNTSYIKFRTYPKNNDDDVSSLDFKFMLETGNTITPYEPYKTNILSTSEDVVLRKVGEVEDTLDLVTGELIQRIFKETIIDYSKTSLYDLSDTFIKVRIPLSTSAKIDTLGCIIAENVPTHDNHVASLEKFGISNKLGLYNNDYHVVYFVIEKEKLQEATLNGIKTYLTQNPITVLYQLATESIKTVDLTVKDENNQPTTFKPIEGTMHIQTDGQPLKPLLVMEIPVEAITQNLTSFIE